MPNSSKISKWINNPANRVASLTCFAVFLFVVMVVFFSSANAGKHEQTFANRQRPPVNFLNEMHDLHMETYECLDCHHRYENGENVLDESELEEGNQDIRCAACHHSEAKTRTREAFHNQCIGCHEKLNDREGGSLPILCGECHVRHGGIPAM